MGANRDTLLDLIAAINDHRRFLDASSLHAQDAASRDHWQQLSHAQAVAVSRITRDIARHDRLGTPLPRAQLERYVDRLIEAYTGDGAEAVDAAAPDAEKARRRSGRG